MAAQQNPKPAPQAQPSPLHFFQTANAHQRSEAIKAAIELDLFTAIAEGNTTAAALARRCQASERGIRILCDFLTIDGFLIKTGDAYALTPDTAFFLDRKQRTYIGDATTFLLNDEMRLGFSRLTDAVRKGGKAADIDPLEPENPIWVKFAHAMMGIQFLPAELLANAAAQSGPAIKVLDIAAGHGLFGIAVARRNPSAQIYAQDWKNVLAVAKENAKAAGLDDRYHLIPGSAFDADLGSGYDLVLCTNFLHHFDVPTCEQVLRRFHSALKPGGRIAIAEFVPNDDRISPGPAAAFSLIMLATTPAGDAYTFSQLESMLRNAGFTGAQHHRLEPTPQSAVIAKKA
jgi:2-polyprenyl-3-methyl-5-hydroxy-6-metoxy-1,4-benzoquinol methylase